METPTIFKKNLKNGIVTDEMLGAAIFSVNKRAKNARDKEQEYRDLYRRNRYCSDEYGNEDRARERKEQYYSFKDELLQFAKNKCVCIHRVGHEHNRRRRIYDYEQEYKEVDDSKVIWSNCYYDRELGTKVYFVDVVVSTYVEYEYFLFYDFGNYSFHHPINLDGVKDEGAELSKYGKEIIEIDSLETYGENIANLMSMNYVKKVLKVLKGESSRKVA